MIEQKSVLKDLETIRSNAPLVHSITNYVVMNTTANALISLGASPVMAHAVEEMEEMASIASALVINIGTLSEKWIEAMFLAGKTANKKGIPVILDPVGAGATSLRTNTCHKLIDEVQPQIIRGNASEIMALVQSGVKTKGVDSTASSDSALDAAKNLALNANTVVSVSGVTDYITDGTEAIAVENGHALMGKLTGTGCTASVVTAAFAAVNSHRLKAAAEAMIVMGTAGEMAAEKADAPGSYYMEFLNALYRIDGESIRKYWKNEE